MDTDDLVPTLAGRPLAPAPPTRPRPRPVVVAVVGLLAALVIACAPHTSATPLSTGDPAFHLLNEFRAGQGRAPLARSGELDFKAQAHAQVVADAGHIFHSADLTDGVSPGWRMIGENVALAPSIEVAQEALEESPPHRKNMLEPGFTEAGIGVAERAGSVYVVQVFVER